MGIKFVDVIEHPDHVARIVQHDHAAGSSHRSRGRERVEIHWQVVDRHLNIDCRSVRLFLFDVESLVRAQNLGRAAAGNDRFQCSARFHSAGHVVDQLAHRYRADFNLEITWTLHVTAHANDARAGVVRPAELRVFRAAHGDDVFHGAKGLDVVHDGRAHVEPEHGGKIRWLDPRIGALALEGFDQSRFLAANVSTGAAINVNIDIEPGAEDVVSQEPVLACFFDCAFEDFRTLREFASYIYVRRPGIEGVAGNRDSFQQLVRVFVNDVAVFERARLGFVSVTNQIDRLLFVWLDEAPFHSAWESGAAAAANS